MLARIAHSILDRRGAPFVTLDLMQGLDTSRNLDVSVVDVLKSTSSTTTTDDIE